MRRDSALTKGEKKLIGYVSERILELLEGDMQGRDLCEKLDSLSMASLRLADELQKGIVAGDEIDVQMCEAITQALAEGFSREVH